MYHMCKIYTLQVSLHDRKFHCPIVLQSPCCWLGWMQMPAMANTQWPMGNGWKWDGGWAAKSNQSAKLEKVICFTLSKALDSMCGTVCGNWTCWKFWKKQFYAVEQSARKWLRHFCLSIGCTRQLVKEMPWCEKICNCLFGREFLIILCTRLLICTDCA